ncbi:hypothetical protein BN871_GS_00090 [Paenibacillus sp. P22]|nr:hypothetical protein BN871_GS_00090 [Paenibacillus sp. P22]
MLLGQPVVTDVVHIQDSVQMIDLMLHAPGQVAFSVQHDRLARPGQRPYLHLLRARHVAVIPRQGEAAFRTRLLTFPVDDLRIDELDQALSAVHHDEAPQDADLRSGKSRSAFPGVQRLGEAVEIADRPLIDAVDLARPAAENRVSERQDFFYGHYSALPSMALWICHPALCLLPGPLHHGPNERPLMSGISRPVIRMPAGQISLQLGILPPQSRIAAEAVAEQQIALPLLAPELVDMQMMGSLSPFALPEKAPRGEFRLGHIFIPDCRERLDECVGDGQMRHADSYVHNRLGGQTRHRGAADMLHPYALPGQRGKNAGLFAFIFRLP